MREAYLKQLADEVNAYHEWYDANTDEWGDPPETRMGRFDEARTDWWERITEAAEELVCEMNEK